MALAGDHQGVDPGRLLKEIEAVVDAFVVEAVGGDMNADQGLARLRDFRLGRARSRDPS